MRPAPALDQNLGLVERGEDFAIQQLIAQLGVKALVIAILPRAAGFDKKRFDTNAAKPASHGLGGELWPIATVDDNTARKSRIWQAARRPIIPPPLPGGNTGRL